MSPNKKPFAGYNDGSEMWCDNVSSYGIDNAVINTCNYFDMNLKREHPSEERQFCRELFTAMYVATSCHMYPSRIIYPYDFMTADERSEAHYYHANRRFNAECARNIDCLINDSCYKTNFYNLEMAAMRAIQEYGFHRICLVLAFNYQSRSGDGRFSTDNRQWTNDFAIQDDVLNDSWLHAHPILIDGFCDYVRKLHQSIGMNHFNLPGVEECGESVCGYEIRRAITTYDAGNGFSTGFVIGYNPRAVSPWVCWQFTVRDGERHYYWGIYGGEEQIAIDAYNARVFVALNK